MRISASRMRLKPMGVSREQTRCGGASMVRDHEATADRVGPMIEKLLADPTELARMSAAVRGAARPAAADDLARWVLELAAGNHAKGAT